MTGYQWLYKGKQAQNVNVDGRYDEFKKEGWSIYPDGRDLNDSPLDVAPTVVVKVEGPVDTVVPTYPCEVCGKIFTMKMHLGAHKRKHKE